MEPPPPGDRPRRRRKLSCLFIAKLVHLAVLMVFVAATLAMTAYLPKQYTQGAAGRSRFACPLAIAALAVSWIIIFALFDDGAYVYQD